MGSSSYSSASMSWLKTPSTFSPNSSSLSWCCLLATCDLIMSSLRLSSFSFRFLISLRLDCSTSFSSFTSESSSSMASASSLACSTLVILETSRLKWWRILPRHLRMEPISRLPMTLRSSKRSLRSLGIFFISPKYFSLSSGVTVILLYSAKMRRGVSDSISLVRGASLQRCMGALSSQPPRFLRSSSNLSMLVISPASWSWKWSASVSLKTYLASNSFSSMKLGARQPEQTTKISAEEKREALGLVASTLSKNFLKTHIKDWKSVDLKTLVTKCPPSLRKEQANLSAARTSSLCVQASLLQLAPTLGAPSLRTTSHFCPLISLRSCSQQVGVVISPWKLLAPGTFLMGSRSTPTMVELRGMHSAATCIQPPGAAQRSMRQVALLRRLYLRLSCMSLQAARERQPCCLAKWQQVSNLAFDFVFFPMLLTANYYTSNRRPPFTIIISPMDPRQQLTQIEEQKRNLQARIQQIGSTRVDEKEGEQAELARLLQRKKMLEEQRRQEQKYQEMEKEYNARKQQMEREKQLERIKNEKRVIELEAAMKRVVFEGIKERIKGMNSDQLMMRGFIATEEGVLDANAPIKPSPSSNFKNSFETYLLKSGPEKVKPKYDLNQLNEKRMQLFEKKEEVVMKQILLKQLAAEDEPPEIDIMSMNRDQLVAELERRQIDLDDYMHPVRKEDIIDHFPEIRGQIQRRIQDKKKELAENKENKQRDEKNRKNLRDQVSSLPFKDVEVVRRLIFDLIDEICNDYDKRHVNRTKQDQEQHGKKLQQEYEEVLNRNLVEQMSNDIIDEMLQQMRNQMVKESAEEVFRLHEFVHQKTEDCFKMVLGDGDITRRLAEIDKMKIPLTFVNQDENQISKPKNDKYAKNLDNNDNNVYETEESTTNLVNDIVLLDAEERYMQKVQSQLKNQKEFKTEETIFTYEKELIAITKQKIQGVYNAKVYQTFSPAIEGLISASKWHRNWLLQSDSSITLLTPWNREEFSNAMGGRISNPCGNITYTEFYPIASFLGSPCSVLMGFDKGQILKYNYNQNRITSRQTNITHYLPVIQHAKSGDQPAFPLDNRNYISVETEKPKPTDEMHEFRQFFEHHSEPIVFASFYRIDKIVSVDRSLKCALWQYSKTKGASTFQPVFKFEIKSSYQLYKEDENPRYKDIYPTADSRQTPEQMYQKYMLTETFLKMQLYNNPKKEIAYFKAPSWQKQQDDKPIWKITYKDSRKQVNKILESFYNVVDGKIIAQQVKLQGESLYILCQREHVIRNDLKTIKIYSWNIQQKRLGRIGLEIDMYKDQKVNNFIILPNLLKGIEMELAIVVNSGRVLMFSLVSGQLLKNINDQMDPTSKQSKYYFKSIINAPDRQLMYAITAGSIAELSWQDGNSLNDRNQLNKAIDSAKRKYFR